MSLFKNNVKEGEFEIDCVAVSRYLQANHFILCLILFGFAFFFCSASGAVGLLCFLTVVSFLYLAFAFWLSEMQASNFRYRLDGDTLRVDGGVFFLFRKSIPLERITDVALVQGPFLRFLGIWEMRIQTAGSTECEAKMYGVLDPEKVRELILSQRHKIYAEKSGDA